MSVFRPPIPVGFHLIGSSKSVASFIVCSVHYIHTKKVGQIGGEQPSVGRLRRSFNLRVRSVLEVGEGFRTRSAL